MISGPMLCIAGMLTTAGTPASHSQEAFLAEPQFNLYRLANHVCGVTATYCALAAIGQRVPLGIITDEIPIGSEGSSFEDIHRFLLVRKIPCRTVKTEDLGIIVSSLAYGKRAAIIHLQDPDHFVCLTNDARGRTFMIDPAADPPWQELTDFVRARYTGVAVVLGEASSPAVVYASVRPRLASLGLATLVGLVLGALVGVGGRYLHKKVEPKI